MSGDSVRAIYAANSAVLAARYEAVASRDHFAPVIDLFPVAPARVADIGAGSGRDAAWFAAAGHQVVAAEPVAELREAASLRHPHPAIQWVADGLPELAAMRDLPPFDLVTLSAVWHHLPPELRPQAMSAMADLLRPGGRLCLSLRHGPLSPERGVHEAQPDRACDLAAAAGLNLLRRIKTDGVGDHASKTGIRWTWLVFTTT